MSKKLKFILLIQIIGTILIVLSHSVSQYTQYPSETGTVVRIIQSMGLTAFMWCSGYLLIYTDSLHRKGYLEYIKTRIIRLMLPYFVIQLVMLVPKIMIAKTQGSTVSLDILHYFLYPREGILPHLWFLPTLMILCILSFVFDKVTDSIVRSACALVIAAILVLLPHITNILAIDDVRQYMFWYALGIVTAKYMKVEKLQKYFSKWYMGIAVLLYVLIELVVPISQVKWILCGLCSLSLLLFIGITLEGRNTGGGYCSKYTFPVYILSLPAQNVVEVFMRRVNANWMISTLLMFAIGVIIPIFLAIIVERIEKNKRVKILSNCIGM